MITTALGNAVTPAAALISMPILTYALGVDGRGQIAAATAPLLLATTAATFGVPEAVTYLVARTPATLRFARRRGATMIALAGVFGTLVSIAASPILAGDTPGLRRLIVMASLALLPTLLVLVLRASAAGLHAWRLVALEQAISAVVRLIAIAGLALAGQLTPTTATAVIALAPVVGGLAYLELPKLAEVARGTEPHSDVGYRPMVSYGSRIWLGSLSGVLLSRLDQVVMTPLSSAYQLGLYAVAVNISDVALILHSAVRDVTFASDAAGRDDERLCASARISGAASIAFGGLLALCVPFGLPLLFGPDFRPAIPSAFVLLVAVVVVTPGSIAGAGLSARGRPGLRSMSLLAASIVNVMVLFLLVPSMGSMGAAIATFIGNVTTSQLNIISMSRVNGIAARRFYGLRRSDVQLVRAKLTRLRPAGNRGHG
ncbi:MAG: polysaccharide biosynthesis protein [Frankiales bacterium]|nr:polysaccharide biosynthesis protein [Frankiales bacterium]